MKALRYLAWLSLLFSAGLLPQSAVAAVPNRSVTFVAIQGSDTAVAQNTAALVAQHAERRLGLNPKKVHVIEGVPTAAAFEDLFRRGQPFQYVSQGDLVIVYIADAQIARSGLKLSEGALPWAKVGGIGKMLRQGPGEDLGFFDGTVLIVLDRGKSARPRMKLKPDTAFLDLAAARAPPVDPVAPAPEIADELAIAGRGALAQLSPEPGARVTPGAIAWVGALERMIGDSSKSGDPEQMLARLKKARPATGVKARLDNGRGYSPDRFRLLLHRLRVVLHPKLLQNVETLELLDRLKLEIERATPAELKPFITVERLAHSDPTARVACQAIANQTTAHLECVEGRAPVFADKIDVTRPAEALAPAVRQILRDYKALAATDWSDRRRDLKALDVVVLVDTSLSMAYHDPTAQTDPELADAPSKREVFLTRLASTLSTHAALRGRPSRLSVLLFGERVTPLRLPKGKDGSVILDKRLGASELAAYAAVFRAAAKPEKYTGISAALTEAVRVLAEGDADAARHVVLLTDGRETMVRQRPEEAVRRAARAVNDVGATLNIVGLTEEGGRLDDYLARMRAGKSVLRRYIEQLDMTFAPRKCRRSDDWDIEQARKCGRFYASTIVKAGAYDAALLDSIRRSKRKGVPTGVFLQPDSVDRFQVELQSLLTQLTGGGIYLTQAGTRGAAGPDDEGVVEDQWALNLDLDGSARVVLYNSGALQDPTFTVLHDGEPIGAAEGVRFEDEGDAVTVVTLPAPARGAWTITRRGKKP